MPAASAPSCCAEYASPLGTISFVLAGPSLCALWFDEPSPPAARAAAQAAAPGREPSSAGEVAAAAAAVRKWLDLYFSGTIPAFTPPLQLCGSAFTQKIASLLLQIPYGSTRTYSGLAREIAAASGRPMAAQAVGGAAGRNPVALIVPCHRLIGAKGNPTGYAYGLRRKLWLLEHERRTLQRLRRTGT